MRTGCGERVKLPSVRLPAAFAMRTALLGQTLLVLLSMLKPVSSVVAQDARAERPNASYERTERSVFYLPVVRGAVAGPPLVLQNGGFENGDDGSWLELSLGDWPIILDTPSLPVPPHDGNWAAWLGGAPNEISFLVQRVTVLADKPHLSYWYWIASVDNCGFDEATIIVNGGDVFSAYHLCEETNTEEWAEATVDLSAYAGEIVLLQLGVETDGSLNSNFFLDDVRFVAVPAGHVSGRSWEVAQWDPT